MRASVEPQASSAATPGFRRNGWPIWAALTSLGLGIVIPVVLYCGFLIFSFGRSENARYHAQVEAYAQEAVAAVDRELKDRVAVLRALANSPLLDSAHLADFYRQAEGVADEIRSTIAVFDPISREQLIDTRVPYETELGGKIPDSVAKQVAKRGREPTISDGGDSSDDPSVKIYLPVERGGATTAVVAMLFERSRLSELLTQDVSAPDWTSAIIGADGVVLARSNAASHFVGTAAPPHLRVRPPDDGVKIIRAPDLDGRLGLVGFAQSSLTPWTVAVSVPSEVIEAPLRRSWWIFGLAGSGFLALSAAIAFAVASYITRPVLGLAQAAATVGQGGVVSPSVSGLREIDVASHALSQASKDRRSSEERQVAFLMRELAHRNKNVLTIVQAIARQTARCADNLKEFESDFYSRLAALAGTNELLVTRDWIGTDPASLVKSQLAPFPELDQGRITTSGPAIVLKPRTAEGLGLALHELATNALKHGALSVPGGLVSIEWQLGGGRFSFVWSEQNGPPVVPFSSSGFGRVVIERMVPELLGAQASLDFRREGLRWTIEMPAELVGHDPAAVARIEKSAM